MAKAPKKPPARAERIPEHVAYFRNKADRPAYSYLDVEAEEHAFVFTVAKATKAEVLATIRQAVDDAIANGETAESFKAKLTPKLVALGWWGSKDMADPLTGEIKHVQLGSPRRLDTIYWANTRTAYAAGAWERAQRTKSTSPYFKYMLGPSEVHRPEHEALEGTILPVDDPFWEKMFPPNGWGCMCWVMQLTRDQAAALGYDASQPAPTLSMTTYTNARTGETMSLPRGVDPGWQSNPGKLRQTMLARHVAGKLDGAPPDIARVVTRDVITSQQFQLIQSRQVKGVAPVAVLPAHRQESMGVSTRTVLLSSDTARKQAGERAPDDPGYRSGGHPEVTRDDYLKVQELLDGGEVHPDGPHHVKLFKQIDGKWWTATIKGTQDGREAYLQSFHRTFESQVNARRRKGERPEGRK